MPLSFLRRREVPPRVSLEPGERLLSWGTRPDGRHVVATTHALLVPVGVPVGDSGEYERIPWWRIDAAGWDNDTSRLVVRARTEYGPRALRLELDEERMLPETVRERVQSSIVVSRHVRLVGKAGVRLTARRVPGKADPVWLEELDRGLDPSDPQVRHQVAAALAELKAQTTS